MKPFQAIQFAFTEYLRRGDSGKPRGRCQEIYRDSIRKNINHAISDIFPTTKRLVQECEWDAMVRGFIEDAHLRTPYLHELGEEFLAYLMHARQPLATDPTFLVELAHFDWIQFALYIAHAELPARQIASASTRNSVWNASPLVVGLTYSYPVHTIDERNFAVDSKSGANHLLVYRNRNDDVEVLATDALSLRIVQVLQASEGITQSQLCNILADELGHESQDAVLATIQESLDTLVNKEILFYQ